ncbi:MAG: transposase, partial [Chloroflexales bacterium]|nr:transposase [Chloroflexales bacterium]
MIPRGEIFRRDGPAYRTRFGSTLSDSQHHAMLAIARCRTQALRGHVYTCPSCGTTRSSSHSCRTRHCPTCQQDAIPAWRAAQHAVLLPLPSFLVPFALPSELRAVARPHPDTISPLRLRTAAAARQQRAHDPRFVGGQIGMLGVLQKGTRALRSPPHVHVLVPALALAPDGKRWLVGKRDFLVHVKPLAQLVRAKFRTALRQTPLAGSAQARVWSTPWVVECRPVGSGAAALQYRAPCIFRIALSNNRIERVVHGKVTFRYTEGKTGERKRETLSGDAFSGRFLRHVLPKGVVNVRSYGLLCPSKRQLLKQARSVLALQQPVSTTTAARAQAAAPLPDARCCPSCGQPMQRIQILPPQRQHLRAAPAGGPARRGPPLSMGMVQARPAFQLCSSQLAFGVPFSS